MGTPTTQYVHVLACPADGIILLPNWAGKATEVQLFESGKALRFEQVSTGLRIFLDQNCDKEKLDQVLVIKLATTR